jgi:nucleotide-binding universal stress UspA family protein
MDVRQILVATDGSPSALAATELALDLAAARGASVAFLHSAPEHADRLYQAVDDAPTPEQVTAFDPVLREAAALAAARSVHATVELIGDDGPEVLVPAIAGIANGVGADLIVLGSRGRAPLTAALLGSVSQGVLRMADVPVLVAHVLGEARDGTPATS